MINTIAVLVLAAVMMLVLFVLYGYLFVIKWVGLIQYGNQRVWINKHLPQIEAYILSGERSRTCIPSRTYEYEALENYLSDYLAVYQVDSHDHPLRSYAAEVFTNRYRRLLHHRKWSVRMNTLYFIQLFKLEQLQPDVLELYRRKGCTPEESYQCLIILAGYQYSGILDLLVEEKYPRIPNFLLNRLINQLVDRDNVTDYVQRFYTLPRDWQLGLLDVIRDQHYRTLEIQQLLENCIRDRDGELRLRAIKAVAYLGYLTTPNIILDLWNRRVQEDDWRGAVPERLMLARLMGKIRYDSFVPMLDILIADEGYSVRSEAAQALRKYKDGVGILKRIAAVHQDGYARNMASEWLERNVAYE